MNDRHPLLLPLSPFPFSIHDQCTLLYSTRTDSESARCIRRDPSFVCDYGLIEIVAGFSFPRFHSVELRYIESRFVFVFVVPEFITKLYNPDDVGGLSMFGNVSEVVRW